MNSSATGRCPSWFGIVCNADGNIYKLNLTASELNAIGLLSKLVYLDFSVNHFSGPIPPEIGMLANLETLHLNENYFNGSIPREIGQLTSLYELALYRNSLQGELPTTLGNLRKLAYLYLDDNELSGQIPPEFGQLVNLLEVYITNNFVEGPIPPAVGKLSKLKVLHLFNNSLTGSIPHEMGSMVSLESLSIFSKNLCGLISSSLGDLTSLNLLHLYNNQLSGPIPIELGNLQSLTDLALSENSLNDSVEVKPCYGGLSVFRSTFRPLTGMTPTHKETTRVNLASGLTPRPSSDVRLREWSGYRWNSIVRVRSLCPLGFFWARTVAGPWAFPLFFTDMCVESLRWTVKIVLSSDVSSRISSEPGGMAPEGSKAVVLPKFDMRIYTSEMTLEELKTTINEYCIPMDLHPRFPHPGMTMDRLLSRYIGMYVEQLEQGGLMVSFSSFFLVVIKHFAVHVSQLVPMGFNRVTLFKIR
nr:MDIS1-interacting receptor like kinase 2-like [Tanacetum cinerariifolium]